ncbi:hypothetical protein J1614_007154 [Plenodomus biglobosus]|nr:hypothetical protein J1614_007154 [Plenodomus biglobosus]
MQGPHMALDYDNSSDWDFDLDLRGRKHLDSVNKSLMIYIKEEAPGSVHGSFPLSGQGNLDALRKSLETHLPLHHITDEYGVIRPLADISNHHLPTLQGKLWREVPQEHAATLTAPMASRTTNQDLNPFVRQTVALRCSNPNCSQQEDEDTSPTPLLKLEPYYHWDTLTHAPDGLLARGKIVVFRRNGAKSKDPLWTLAMEEFKPSDRLAYCTRCLEELMANVVATWSSVDLAIAPSQPELRPFRTFSDSPRPVPAWSHVHPVHNGPSEVSSYPRPETGSSHEDPDAKIALQLDGTNETPNSKQQRRSLRLSKAARNIPNKVSIRFEDSIGQKEGHHVSEGANYLKPEHSHNNNGALKNPPIALSTINITAQLSLMDSSPSVRGRQKTPVPSRWCINLTSQSQNQGELLEVDDGQDLSSKTATGASKSTGKRPFGHEINPNIVKHSSRRPTSKKVVNKAKVIGQDIPSFPTPTFEKPAPPTSTTGDRTATDVQPNYGVDTLDAMPETTKIQGNIGSDAAEAPTRVRLRLFQRLPCSFTPTEKVVVSRQRKDGGVKKTALPMTCATKPLPQSKAARKPHPPPKPTTSTKRAASVPRKPQGLFIPVFAKRTPLIDVDVPEDTDHDAYKAYLNTMPSPSNLICICKKPAYTHDVEIAQCGIQACKIRWFHRACLDKKGKLSIRFGTLVCMVCRDEKVIKEMAETEGWNTGTLEEEEMKLALCCRDLADDLPGPGGVDNVVHAYGFGVPVMEPEPVVAKKDERSLGMLGWIGYVQSRPEQFVKAYGNAEANKMIADEEWNDTRMAEAADAEDDDELDDEADEEEREEEEGYSTGDSKEEDSLDPLKYWMGAEIIHAI